MVVPTEDSVITEMTSTLRDWGAMWKQLYVVNMSVNTAVRPQTDVGCVHKLYFQLFRNQLIIFQWYSYDFLLKL